MGAGAGEASLILHGGLLLVVFVYMVPLSISLVRHKYGHHHAYINLIAFGTVALAVLVKKFFKTTTTTTSASASASTGNHWTLPFGVSHSTVGWCLSFVLFSQLLIGLIRPGKEFAETRRSWFFIHVTLGYATVILSIIALVTGCSAALEDGHLQLILGVFVPVIVLLYICTYYFYREESNRKNASTSTGNTSIEEGKEREAIEIGCVEVDTLNNSAYVQHNYTLL